MRALLGDQRDSPQDDYAPKLQRLLAAESERPFDLERGPLLRVRVWHVCASRHALQLTMHHIVSDGWSMGVVLKDLATYYSAACRSERFGRPSPDSLTNTVEVDEIPVLGTGKTDYQALKKML